MFHKKREELEEFFSSKVPMQRGPCISNFSLFLGATTMIFQNQVRLMQ